MKKSFTLYYLYCMNIQCQVSIYHRNEEVKIPLNIENLLASHTCACCNQPLTSAIDLEMKRVVAEVNTRKVLRPSFFNN